MCRQPVTVNVALAWPPLWLPRTATTFAPAAAWGIVSVVVKRPVGLYCSHH